MSAESINALDDIKEYTVFTSDIDLLADSPNGALPARWLLVVDVGTGGTLDIDTTTTAGRALTGVLPGHELRCKMNKINLATDLAKVWVGW